jgi:hypothetical protein
LLPPLNSYTDPRHRCAVGIPCIATLEPNSFGPDPVLEECRPAHVCSQQLTTACSQQLTSACQPPAAAAAHPSALPRLLSPTHHQKHSVAHGPAHPALRQPAASLSAAPSLPWPSPPWPFSPTNHQRCPPHTCCCAWR